MLDSLNLLKLGREREKDGEIDIMQAYLWNGATLCLCRVGNFNSRRCSHLTYEIVTIFMFRRSSSKVDELLE